MADKDGAVVHQLVVESWAMYGVGILLYLWRVCTRCRSVGLDWYAEDYLMVIAIVWFTAFIVINVALTNGRVHSQYRLDQQGAIAEDVEARRALSTLEFILEQCILHVIYIVKACMLLAHHHLTKSLNLQFWANIVKLCALYTLIGYTVTQMTIFLACRPFLGYFEVPAPEGECRTYFAYQIVQAAFNISSDIAIFCVIMPTLWRLKIAWQDKIPLLITFSMGLYLIFCAVTSKAFTGFSRMDEGYQFWYLREAAARIYISNLPYAWCLLRRVFNLTRKNPVKKTDSQVPLNEIGGPENTVTGGRRHISTTYIGSSVIL